MLQKYCFLSEPPHVFTHFLRECAIAQLEMVFAMPLREPFQVKWSLRRRCESHPKRNGLCDAVARAIPSEMVFATPSQEPSQVKWSLRRRREGHPERNETANGGGKPLPFRVLSKTIFKHQNF